MKQQTIYKITGMQQDVADSSMDKQHAYDIRNMRFRNSGTNSVAALINEPGNIMAVDIDGNPATIRGTVLGFNTINDTGILFTHEDEAFHYITPSIVHAEYNTPSLRASLRVPAVEPTIVDRYLMMYRIEDSSGSDFRNLIDSYVYNKRTDVNIEGVIYINRFPSASSFMYTGYDVENESYSEDVISVLANGEHIKIKKITKNSQSSYSDAVYIKNVEVREANESNGAKPVKIGFKLTIPELTSEKQTITDVIHFQTQAFPINTDGEWGVLVADITFVLELPAVEQPGGGGDEPEPEPEPVPFDIDLLPQELSNKGCDHIYLVKVATNTSAQLRASVNNNGMPRLEVFEYFRGDLGFSLDHPIESTVFFENEEIQKIYWTDGLNQLRYANIENKNKDGNGAFTHWTDNLMFDTVPLLHLQEQVTVTRNSTGGTFPSGAVQFAASYLHRYGSESNLFWVSPLYYSSPDNRGGKPDEICSNSFTVTITQYEVNGRFEYIRLYHILHTTLDGAPELRRVADIPIPTEVYYADDDTEHTTPLYPPVVYTDTNTTGEALDPNEFLYSGSNMSVIPQTLEQKSNTLFLGNLRQSFGYIRDLLENTDLVWGKDDSGLGFVTKSTDVPADNFSGYYSHVNQLQYDSRQITSFRQGDTYRFGFQAQDTSGKWSDVWWIGDKTNNTASPRFGSDGNAQRLHHVVAEWLLDTDAAAVLRRKGYRKVRPVVVYPQTWERNIHTEGLLNPTVYNTKDRAGNSPYAQSSWFLRPFAPIDMCSFDIDVDSNPNYHLYLGPTGNVMSNMSNIPGDTNNKWHENYPYPLSWEYLNATVSYPEAEWRNLKWLAIDSFIYPSNNDSGRWALSLDVSNFGSWPEFRHNQPLGDSQSRNGEIQSMYNTRPIYDAFQETNPISGITVNRVTFANSTAGVTQGKVLKYEAAVPYTSSGESYRRNFVNRYSQFYYVDQSILTMNSADIDFDPTFAAVNPGGWKMRITGIVPIDSFVSSYDIRTNTPPNKYFTEDNDSPLIAPGFYASEIVGATMSDKGYGWRSLINAPLWFDDISHSSGKKSKSVSTYHQKEYNNDRKAASGFAVYPWHGSGSLNNDSIGSRKVYPKDDNDKDSKKESKSAVGDNYISAELKYKTIANLHYSYDTYRLTDMSDAYDCSCGIAFALDNQQVSLVKLAEQFEGSGSLNYFGAVDKLLTANVSAFSFIQTISTESDENEVGDDNSQTSDTASTLSYNLFPMSCQGGYPRMVSFIPYFYKEFVSPSQSHLNFYAPYSPMGFWNTLTASPSLGDDNGWYLESGDDKSTAPISIKYKSCSHAVVSLYGAVINNLAYQRCVGWDLTATRTFMNADIALPSTAVGSSSSPASDDVTLYPFWDKQAEVVGHKDWLLLKSDASFRNVTYNHSSFDRIIFDAGDSEKERSSGFLYMGQLYRDESSVLNRFGGSSDEALEQNIWLPAGEEVYLDAEIENDVKLTWQVGDTYYQRYDALRTYPFTEEDVNKVIDIVSFMTETHINIDGRYDNNRGLTNNNHVRPKNFNLLNPVYSQRDNFFTYNAVNRKKTHLDVFNYSFTWTLSKTPGSLRDEWTRINLGASYNCDGNKGDLTRLARHGSNLMAFQEGGVAQILFDEATQLQSTDGLPIEIANSGKMQGLRYLSTEVGCQNKWSLASFPDSLYWIDGRLHEFYSINDQGQLVPVSTIKLMSSWFDHRKDLTTPWTPRDFSGIFSHRDQSTGELFITASDICLCYDTVAGEFTSFYDYNKTDAIFNVGGYVLSVAASRNIQTLSNVMVNDSLWFHRADKRNNCNFYGKQYPFWVEVVCNSNNHGSDYGTDKVFDNMSWRSDAWSYLTHDDSWQYKPFVTFTDISGFTNYQTLKSALNGVNGSPADDYIPQKSHPLRRNGKQVNLRKKFKVWNTTIPRAENTVRDRIRDTWCHLRLTTSADISRYRQILHDIVISYFIQ